ncbi:MAG: VWA domain-containing protein [Thermoanaerobaculia bacterium]|jgi:VWFA-related protein
MRVRPIVAVLLLLATPHLESQEPTNFGATLDVRIINVDVVVRDKAGQLVSGLTASDFVIYEQGKPQPITNFAEYREESQAPPQAPELPDAAPVAAKPPQTRHLVFFFERLDLRETQPRLEFFAGLRSFVTESMRDGDTATVYYFETATGLQNLLPMTGDRSALLAVIDKVAEESKLRLDVAEAEASELAMRARVAAADGVAMSARGWANDAATTVQMGSRFAAQRAYDRQRQKVFAINAVIQGLSGLEGRKVMILAADRISKHPGLEYGYGGKEFNARSQMDDIVDTANAAGVTIYAYYPKGLPMDPMKPSGYEILMNDSEVLDSIATRTGGTFAAGGRLGAMDLGGAAKQLDNYYSLAYRATDSRNDRTRAIRVEVLRPGLEVLARSAIVDKTDDEIARDRMISSMLFGMAPSTISISLTQGNVKRRGLTTLKVPVEITIPIAQLTALPGRKGYEGSFRVLAAAANPEGDISDVAEKRQAFHIPLKDFESSRSRTFTYTLEIVVRDTSDRALVAVIDDLDNDVGYAAVVLDMTKVEKAQPVTNTRPKWQPIAAPSTPSGSRP